MGRREEYRMDGENGLDGKFSDLFPSIPSFLSVP